MKSRSADPDFVWMSRFKAAMEAWLRAISSATMADGAVDVVLPGAGRGDGEQRSDRPALDDLELVVDQAPFDVLGAADVRFDAPTQLREPHDLRIRQRWLLLPLRLDRLFLRPACRRGVDGKLLGGNRLGDDLAVPHPVDIRVHQAGGHGLAQAEAGLHR